VQRREPVQRIFPLQSPRSWEKGEAVDWSDSSEQATFRAEVRALIAERLPERYRVPGGDWSLDRRSADPEARAAAQQWTDALSERGWFAPHWPSEYGGAGLSTWEQAIFREEMAKAHAPVVGGSGVLQYGSTLILIGSEEQKQEHLPAILRGDELVQSGLSEPGAGSDLASLQTRAVRDGDDYVVNGQKIWTSNGHLADYLWVPVRTDPSAPKHRGISVLMISTKLPGVQLRPLINMGWEHGFNETFFEDVRVPARQRIGEENRGWYVGMTALDFERSGIAGSATIRRDVDELAAYLRTSEGRARSRLGGSPGLRARIADDAVAAEVHYNLSLRIASMQANGQVPNMEASMGKVFGTELTQRLARTGASVFGLYTNLWDEDDPRAPMQARQTRAYVRTVPSTIAGGTSEIQRNIIATRGLGLPRG
jgi:alkylation response protein AidB-like acyl-CoA dehydrogenase